jgi:hypothetical protein
MPGCWRAVSLVLACAALPCGQASASEAASGSRVCDAAEGWRVCVEIPEGADPGRTSPFAAIAYKDGPGHLFNPWTHWSGSDWEDLIIKLLPRGRPPAEYDDRALLAWAGFWDADSRAREIAAGQSRLSAPPPFKLSTYVDGKGRRWPHAVRHTRTLTPWIVRTEHILVMPLNREGLRLELKLNCTSSTGNCRRLNDIVSSLSWHELPEPSAETPLQLGVAMLRDDGVLEISLSRDMDGNAVHGYFELHPEDPRYAREREHIGEMAPGREVPYFANRQESE